MRFHPLPHPAKSASCCDTRWRKRLSGTMIFSASLPPPPEGATRPPITFAPPRFSGENAANAHTPKARRYNLQLNAKLIQINENAKIHATL
jgi:hypothetical protein